MSDTEPENIGGDGTIPNTDTGIAVGHDSDPSTFEPEEDAGPEEGGAARGAGGESDADGQATREVAADEQGLAEFGEDPDIETPSGG